MALLKSAANRDRTVRAATAKVEQLGGSVGRTRSKFLSRHSQGVLGELRSIPVARLSRPPGFDMTYRPSERVFLAPWSQRLPSLVYLVGAVLVLAVVLVAEGSSSNSVLYVRVIEENSRRLMSPRVFALLLFVSALATVVRGGMRGVRIRGDGIEYRDVVSGFWPKLRRMRWPQIDRIVLDVPSEIVVELWDNSRVYLPRVEDREGLMLALENVAAARAIPVQGGLGLDEIPESEDGLEGNPAE